MKKIIASLGILVHIFIFSFCFQAVSEHESLATQPSKTVWFRVEPLLLILGGLDFRLGLQTSERTSMVFALDGHFFWPPISIAPVSQLWGVGGGLGFHWTPRSPMHENGLYIEPMIRAGYSGLVPSKSHAVIIPTIESGYKWRFENAISIYTGLSLNYLIAPNLGDGWVPNFPIPLLHFGLGFR